MSDVRAPSRTAADLARFDHLDWNSDNGIAAMYQDFADWWAGLAVEFWRDYDE